jgi:methyl-accepting chemotaxis protein
MNFNLFARLRIATRIAGGFAVTLALLAVLGTIGVLSLNSSETAFGVYAQVGDNTVRIAEIDSDFINLRRNVYIYSVTGDEQVLRNSRDIATKLTKQIADTAAIMRSAERRGMLEAMSALLDGYVANIEIAARDRVARDQSLDAMNAAGVKARSDLTEIATGAMKESDFEAAALAGQVQEALMRARLDAMRFAGRADPKLVDSFKQNYQSYRSAVTLLVEALQTAQRKRLVTEAGQQAAAYARHFDQFVAVSLSIDKLVNVTMPEQALRIEHAVADLVKAQRSGLADIKTETVTSMERSGTSMIAIAGGALVLGLLIAFLIARSIVKPVSGLTGGMKELADGNFDVVLPGLDRKDEVGEMAQAVETFKVKLAEKARRDAEEKAEADRKATEDKRLADEREAAQARAAEERSEAERLAAMHKLADEFERSVGTIVDNVSAAATELEAAATTLTKTAEVTQELSTVVASASEEASANVQSVASATEEMTGSVNEISRQVQESTRIAAEAVTQAQKTDTRITELSHAASRIGDVVKLITAIAEQTNLLALNATIEAARAGESGKGFAVVAQEVKALAAQTAKATGEIGAQISSMQSATNESVGAIKEIGSTISHISQIAATIAAAVEEQGAATAEIARNVQEAAKGTSQVTGNIANVNRGASETGSASSQVLSSAQSLSSESNHLKIEVANFLLAVRAGPGNRRKQDDPDYAGPERRSHQQPAAAARSRAA